VKTSLHHRPRQRRDSVRRHARLDGETHAKLEEFACIFYQARIRRAQSYEPIT
jgi:hypothetical protein